MKTTQLFVELLVIGFGGLAWLLLFLVACTGYLPPTFFGLELGSLTGLMPVLSLTYVLGIVIDRAADKIFSRLDAKHRKKIFDDDIGRYYESRRILLVHGSALWEHLEYGRSRLRICRGWTLNAFLILVGANLYALRAGSFWTSQVAFLNVVMALATAACFLAWRQLNQSEYKKIERQAPWIERMSNLEKTQ